MLHYLTFVNSSEHELDELLLQLGAVKSKGLYDFVVATNDARKMIAKVSQFECSSMTLLTARRRIPNDDALLLANLKNIEQIGSSRGSGCYNFVGRKGEVDLENVLGHLELELEWPIYPRRGKFVPLAGRNYKPARTERSATAEEVESYIENCRRIAEFIDAFNPTLIYAPARGAKPIVDTSLYFTVRPYRLYYPVTSSFVRNGRRNNYKEIADIFNHHVNTAARVLYVEEIVSGGMTQGHYNEIRKAEAMRLSFNPVEIKVAGLVHQNGTKLNEHLGSRFNELEELDIFFLRYVPNLFTLDDNRQLGTHYLDYSFGPHNVPFGDHGNSILGRSMKEIAEVGH